MFSLTMASAKSSVNRKVIKLWLDLEELYSFAANRWKNVLDQENRGISIFIITITSVLSKPLLYSRKSKKRFSIILKYFWEKWQTNASYISINTFYIPNIICKIRKWLSSLISNIYHWSKIKSKFNNSFTNLIFVYKQNPI